MIKKNIIHEFLFYVPKKVLPYNICLFMIWNFAYKKPDIMLQYNVCPNYDYK